MSDAILEGFGSAVKEIKEEEFNEKLSKISPFDFVNSINFTKQNLIIDERTENEYNPFIVNRGLGFNPDTILVYQMRLPSGFTWSVLMVDRVEISVGQEITL